MREVIERVPSLGAEVVALHVTTSNTSARLIYDRLGFVEESLFLYARSLTLEERLSLSSREAVVRVDPRADRRRPGRGARGRDLRATAAWALEGSVVMPSRNGWTAVYDESCDRDPEMLRRLAVDISNRTGAVILVDRARGGDGRPLHPPRVGPGRGRVRLGSRVPRSPASGRCRGARRQPYGCRAADRRRPESRARDREDRAPCRPSYRLRVISSSRSRRCSGWRARPTATGARARNPGHS